MRNLQSDTPDISCLCLFHLSSMVCWLPALTYTGCVFSSSCSTHVHNCAVTNFHVKKKNCNQVAAGLLLYYCKIYSILLFVTLYFTLWSWVGKAHNGHEALLYMGHTGCLCPCNVWLCTLLSLDHLSRITLNNGICRTLNEKSSESIG